jgi:hypothetical protein
LDGIEYHKIATIMNKSNDSLRQGTKRLRKILKEKLTAELL